MKIAGLALSCLVLASLASGDSFDKPLKKVVMDFGKSPYTEGSTLKLSCYFYPAFVVKEYDAGEKGAESLAIAPIQEGAEPACSRDPAPGEMWIDPDDWSGYFKGVKGNFAFFDADDGHDGGLPFAIFDAGSLKKLFEDDAYDSSMESKKADRSPFNSLQVDKTSDGKVSLRYLRVVETDCDLRRKEAACWDELRKKLQLKTARMPICTQYERATTRWASALAYPVEVILFPKPVITPIAGPVKCWPVD